MDRKSIIVVVGCIGLIMLWVGVIVPRFLTPKPLPGGPTNTVTTAQTVATTSVTQTATSAPPTLAPVTAPKPAFLASGAEEILVLTNDDARYTFTSLGGGLKRIELVQYPETVSRARKKQPLTNNLAELNAHVSMPELAVLGDDSVQGDGVFALTKTETGVRAEKVLTNGLRLVKEFQPST